MKPYYNSIDIIPNKGLAYSPVEESLTPEYVSECVNYRLSEKPGFYTTRQGLRAFHVLDTGIVSEQSYVLSENPYFPQDLGNVFISELFIRDVLDSSAQNCAYWVPVNIWGDEWVQYWNTPSLRFQSYLSVVKTIGPERWQGEHGNQVMQSCVFPAFRPQVFAQNFGWNAQRWNRFLLFAQRKTSPEFISGGVSVWGQVDENMNWVISNRYGLVPAGTTVYFLPLHSISDSLQQLVIPNNAYLGEKQQIDKQYGFAMGFIQSADWRWASPNISFTLGVGKATFLESYTDSVIIDTKNVYPVEYWGQQVTHLRWHTVVSHPRALQIWGCHSENGKLLHIGYNIGDYVIVDISDLARELQHDEPHLIVMQEAASGRPNPAVVSFDVRHLDENSEVEYGLALYKYYLPRRYGLKPRDNFTSGIEHWQVGEPIPHGARYFYARGERTADRDSLYVKIDRTAELRDLEAWQIASKSVLVGWGTDNPILTQFAYYYDQVWPTVALNSRSIWGDHRPLITGWTVKNHIGDGFWTAGVTRTMMVDKDLHYVFVNRDFSAAPFDDLFGNVSLLNPDVDPVRFMEKRGGEYVERTLPERATDVYVWDDFKVKYRLCSGRVRGLCLETHYDRTWNKEKPINPKLFPLKEPDALERLAPISGWYYRIVYEYEDGTLSNPSPAIGAPMLLWSIFSDEEVKQIRETLGKGYTRPLQPNIVDGRETVYPLAFYDSPVGLGPYTFERNIELPAGEHIFRVTLPQLPAGVNKLIDLWRSLRKRLYSPSHWLYWDNSKQMDFTEEWQLIGLFSPTDMVYLEGYCGEGFSAEIVPEGNSIKSTGADIILRTKKKFRFAVPLVPTGSYVTRNSLFTEKGVYRLTYRRKAWQNDVILHEYGKFFYYPMDWWNLVEPNQWGYSPATPGRVRAKPVEYSLDRAGWYEADYDIRYEADAGQFQSDYPFKYGVISVWSSPAELETVYQNRNTNPAAFQDYKVRVASAVPNSYIQIMFRGAGNTLSPPMWGNDCDLESDVLFATSFGTQCKPVMDYEEYLKGMPAIWPWNQKEPLIAASDWAEGYTTDRVGRSVELEIFSTSEDEWDTFFVNVIAPQWDADNADYPVGHSIQNERWRSIIRYCRSESERLIAVRDDVPPQVVERLFVTGHAEIRLASSRFTSSSPTHVSWASTRKVFGAANNNVDGFSSSHTFLVRVYDWGDTDYIRTNDGYYIPFRTANVPHIKSRWVPVIPGHTVFYMLPQLRRGDGKLNPDDDTPAIATLYSLEKNDRGAGYMYDGSIWHVWHVHQWWLNNQVTQCLDNNRHLFPDNTSWIGAVLRPFTQWEVGLDYPVAPLVPDGEATSVWRLYGPDWHLVPDAIQIRNDIVWQIWNYVPTQVYYWAYSLDWEDDYEVRWNRPYTAERGKLNSYYLGLGDSREDSWLSYGIADLWYNNEVATRSNIDIALYLEGDRVLFAEQVTAYFTSYVLFRAPRLGLFFDRRLLSPRIRRIHIYRSRSVESDQWNPEEFGYVASVPVNWKWEVDQDGNGHWKLEEDPYFFDNVPDDSVDFSDSPSRHNSLEFGISSVANLTLSERVYYGNFHELYMPLGTTTFNTLWKGGGDFALLDPIRWGTCIDVEQSIQTGEYVYNVPPPSGAPALFPGYGSVYANIEPGVELQETEQQPQAPAYMTMAVDSAGYYSDVFHSPVLPGQRVATPVLPSDNIPRAYTFWGIAPPIEDQVGVYIWRCTQYREIDTGQSWNPRWRIAQEVYVNSGGTAIDKGKPFTGESLLKHDWAWVRLEPETLTSSNLVCTPFTKFVLQQHESAIRWSDIGRPTIIRPSSIEFIREGDGSGIMALVPTYHGNILAFKQNSVVRLMLAGDFTIARRDQLSDTIGILNPFAWAVHGNIVFFASRHGIFACDDNTIQDITGPIAEEYFRRINEIYGGSPNPVAGLVRVFFNPLYSELYINLPPVSFYSISNRDPQMAATTSERPVPIGTVFAYSLEQKAWTTYSYVTVELLNWRLSRAIAWRGLDTSIISHPILSGARNYYHDSMGRVWNAPLVPSNLSLGGQLYLEGPHQPFTRWYGSVDDYFIEFNFTQENAYIFSLNPLETNIKCALVPAWVSSAGIREMMTIKKKVREFANVLAWKTPPSFSLPYTPDWWEQEVQRPFIRSFMSIRTYRHTASSHAYYPEVRTFVGIWEDLSLDGELWVVPSTDILTATFADRGEVIRFHTFTVGPVLFKGWKALVREAETFVR